VQWQGLALGEPPSWSRLTPAPGKYAEDKQEKWDGSFSYLITFEWIFYWERFGVLIRIIVKGYYFCLIFSKLILIKYNFWKFKRKKTVIYCDFYFVDLRDIWRRLLEVVAVGVGTHAALLSAVAGSEELLQVATTVDWTNPNMFGIFYFLVQYMVLHCIKRIFSKESFFTKW